MTAAGTRIHHRTCAVKATPEYECTSRNRRRLVVQICLKHAVRGRDYDVRPAASSLPQRRFPMNSPPDDDFTR